MNYDYINRERAKAGLPSVEQEMEHLGLAPDNNAQGNGSVFGMQFAEPDYETFRPNVRETPLNRDCLQDAAYREDLRYQERVTGAGFAVPAYISPYGTGSYPPCYNTIQAVQSRRWVDVPFWFAWACTALDVAAGAVLITGFLLALNFPPLAIWMSFGLTVFFGSLLLAVFFRARHRKQGRQEV